MVLNNLLKEDLKRFSEKQSIGVIIQPKYQLLFKDISFVDMYVGTYLDRKLNKFEDEKFFKLFNFERIFSIELSIELIVVKNIINNFAHLFSFLF